jgi:hypothetical protein
VEIEAGEAGLMASSFAVGYMLAVPVLTALTHRVDARLVLLVGSLVSGLATLAFGLFANGLVSAVLIWGTAGMGFAGAYMPGLKALTDRLGGMEISRSVTLYPACFSLWGSDFPIWLPNSLRSTGLAGCLLCHSSRTAGDGRCLHCHGSHRANWIIKTGPRLQASLSESHVSNPWLRHSLLRALRLPDLDCSILGFLSRRGTVDQPL